MAEETYKLVAEEVGIWRPGRGGWGKQQELLEGTDALAEGAPEKRKEFFNFVFMADLLVIPS